MKTNLRFILPLIALSLCGTSLRAASAYWDINGATAGAGGDAPSGTWDTGISANWSADVTGASAVTTWTDANDAVFSAGTDATNAFIVNIAGSPVTGNLTIEEGNITISGGTALNVGGGVAGKGIIDVLGTSALTITSPISGGDTNGSIRKALTASGGGPLTLLGQNTFNGQLFVNAGTLVFDSVGNVNGGPSALGNPTNAALGVINIGSGAVAGVLKYIGSGHTTDRALNQAGSSGTATISASGTGPIVFTSPLGVMNTGSENKMLSLIGTNKDNNTITGTIVNYSGTKYTRLEKRESGTWVLLGENTYSGVCDIREGTLVANSVADEGQPSSLGTGTAGNAHEIIGLGAFGVTNATLKYIGSGHSTSRPFRLWGATTNGGGIVEASGTGPLVLNGAITRPPADVKEKTFVLTGTNTGLNTLGGEIQDSLSGMKTHVTKDGPGTWILTAPNTYKGNTTINQGTLLIGMFGSTTAESTVTVNSGATIGGLGSINGPVTVLPGGTVSPGEGAIGVITFNSSLTLMGNLYIEVNKSIPANDLIQVAEVLTNAGTGTVTVANLGPALAEGDSFQIFSQGISNGLALTISSPGVVWTNKLQHDGTIAVLSLSPVSPVAAATNLTIVATGPASFSLGGMGAANSPYNVYASTNIALPMNDWWLIGTTNSSVGGVIQFLDPQATNGQRFYRFGQPAN